MPPIDFNGLDSAVHGPVRLGVLTSLRMAGALDFSTLKQRLDVVDGILGAHLKKLEEIGYIASRKSFVARRPKTTYRITPQGCKALSHYLGAMKTLIDAVDSETKST